MTTTPARQPKGRPTGGQFAGKCNPEPPEDELAGPQQWDFESASDAARSGDLPADFDQWTLANRYEWTVAHSAARTGHLPPDFDQWSLADEDGWTVAHSAAITGHLPPDFDQWGSVVDKDRRAERSGGGWSGPSSPGLKHVLTVGVAEAVDPHLGSKRSTTASCYDPERSAGNARMSLVRPSRRCPPPTAQPDRVRAA